MAARRRARRLRTAVTALAVLSLVVAGCGSGGDTGDSGDEGESVQLTYASVVGENDTFARQASWFMEETERRSDGRISWRTYWNNSLLTPTDMFAGVRDGRADAGHVANVYAPQNLPLSQITVPFISNNGEAVTRTLEKLYAENTDFREEWEGQGTKVLAFGITGNATIGLKEPADSLADLNGKRLRAVGLTGEALQEVGVAPTGITVNEVYEAVQRGVVDGYAGLPFQTAMSAKLPEVTKYNLDAGMGVFAVVGLVTMSKRSWDRLPADLQEIMLDVADEVTDSTVDMVTEAGEQACDTLLDAGGSVAVVPEDEQRQWRERVFEPKILAKYRSDATAAGVDEAVVDSFLEQFRSTVADFESRSSFVDGFTACAERS